MIRIDFTFSVSTAIKIKILCKNENNIVVWYCILLYVNIAYFRMFYSGIFEIKLIYQFEFLSYLLSQNTSLYSMASELELTYRLQYSYKSDLIISKATTDF